MTYLFKNLKTNERFTIEAESFQEAVNKAFKVCAFSQILTEI
jgi:hypothetical protein